MNSAFWYIVWVSKMHRDGYPLNHTMSMTRFWLETISSCDIAALNWKDPELYSLQVVQAELMSFSVDLIDGFTFSGSYLLSSS